jgi:MYXO-CTERM domain-containing protein
MSIVRKLMKILGVLMIAMGLLWIGQGLNLIRWPASSFMIGVPQWSWNGAGLAALGAALIWFVRRR